jgi:demethylmenaquinone methyltransferase / 2-methoxy-6-polyprenyl-1,4-benzoquinol methylase
VRELRLQGRETLLDLCTGTADVAIAAVRPGAGAARVVGVDFSPEMLRIGLQKCRRRGVWPRVGLVCADATCIPLSDSSVDAATVAFGIRNVQDTAAACRELARVVRTGGRLAVLEFGLPRQRTLRAFYLWYSHRLLPAVGRLVSQHASAYQYLPESVARFPPPEEFGRMLQQSGFPHVRVVPLTFGIVYLYVAER